MADSARIGPDLPIDLSVATGLDGADFASSDSEDGGPLSGDAVVVLIEEVASVSNDAVGVGDAAGVADAADAHGNDTAADASADAEPAPMDNSTLLCGDSVGTVPDPGNSGPIIDLPPITPFAPSVTDCPIVSVDAEVTSTVDLAPLFTHVYDCYQIELGKYSCVAGGLSTVMPINDDEVIVFGARAAGKTIDELVHVPTLVRVSHTGGIAWKTELPAVDVETGVYAWNASLMSSGDILVLGLAPTPDGVRRAMWIVNPEGELVHHSVGDDSGFNDALAAYRGAAPYAPGAVAVGSGGGGSLGPALHFLTRWDSEGNVLAEQAYLNPTSGSAGSGVWDSGHLAVAAPADCGFAIVGRTKAGPCPLHLLRTDGHGTPVARWEYSFDAICYSLPVFAGSSGSDIFVSATRDEQVLGWRPELLRLGSTTGEPAAVYALPKQTGVYATASIGLQSGIVLLASGTWTDPYVPGVVPTVHVFPPIGCPVASYGFSDLQGTSGLPAGALVSLVRLGNGSFAAVDATDIGPPEGAMSTRIYFFNLPAVDAIESALPAQGP